MPNISREHALCIYYQLKYSGNNVSTAKQRFSTIETEHEICYTDDPTIPVVSLKERVYGNPFIFKEYISEEAECVEATIEEDGPKLETKIQVLKFLDEAYLPEHYLPDNHESGVYVRKILTLAEIFANMNIRASYVASMSQRGFSSFCGKNQVGFIKQKESQNRKRTYDGSNVRKWVVYEMKKEYQDNLIKEIISYPERYQDLIGNYKKEGMAIIGYARKSPGSEKKDTRIALLSTMMNLLRSRSMVDKVFISLCSRASEPIADRDKSDTLAVKDADGSTQDMINLLNNTHEKVILVVIDYAGLTTDPNDLSLFVRKHEMVDQIFVDRLPTEYKVERYTRHQILHDEKCRKKFDCRPKPVQRSLT